MRAPESFSDYENRLSRADLRAQRLRLPPGDQRGKIEAKVAGQEVYNLTIDIETLPKNKWKAVKKRAGQIGSLIELLQGNLSDHVMEVVTDREQGLFPCPARFPSIATAPTGP